jgi:predicted transposase YbfD/YdcC
MEDVLGHFATLQDPRSEVNRKHPLASVIVIAIMGILAGAAGPTAIAEWAKSHVDFVRSYVPLPNGIPRKDVFRRLLCALKPDAFQACFENWLESLRSAAAAATGVDRPNFAVDGKTLRRSHDKKGGLAALHCVSVWVREFGITLAQVATDQKSNEITAIPEVLQLVDMTGAIVTIDAMGTQKEIAKVIVDGGGDYVLALKGNQGTMHDAVINHVIENMESDFANVETQQVVTTEKGHGRVETRQVIQMKAPESLPGFAQWLGLATIGVAILTCVRKGVTTTEVRYFISSLPMGVDRLAQAIRSHWGIENTCHWCLDVTYREDESRMREKNARENLAWLYRFTLSLLKQHSGKQTVAAKRRQCGWNPAFLAEVLTGTRR